MNWGHKITLVFIAFASLIGYLVYNCMRTPISLVSAEYYKDELNYQQVIDGTNRANALDAKAQVTLQDGFINLQLPTQQACGNIWFYSVNDAKKDRKLLLDINEHGQQQFDLDKFSSGKYVVKIAWIAEGKQYYSQNEIVISK